MRIGLIADTHGYLGDDVIAALQRCDQVLHAGDIGRGVLDALAQIAPVIAVRGNNDLSGPEAALPGVAYFDAPGGRIAVVHTLVDAPRNGYDLLLFGHCHRRHDYVANGARFINPGAAGRRGFHTARSVAILEAGPAGAHLEFIDLGPRSAARPSRTLVRS